MEKIGTKERIENLNKAKILLSIPNYITELWDTERKIKLYTGIRELCSTKSKKNEETLVQKAISSMDDKLRNFDYEIEGVENIPSNGAIFAFNHSNAHDAITLLQVLSKLGLPISILVTKEGVSPLIRLLYKSAKFTIIDRTDKESCLDGTVDVISKLMSGGYVAIAPESTWNLHPIKPMQNIKLGVSKISAITQTEIVPTIMEYVEVPKLCQKEDELYTKCVIKFGKPIKAEFDENIFFFTDELQRRMESMRRNIWTQNGIQRETLSDVNPSLYVNHTGLKVGLGSKSVAAFDYEREKSNILVKNGETREFMYTIDKNGDFVPGELKEEVFVKTLKL